MEIEEFLELAEESSIVKGAGREQQILEFLETEPKAYTCKEIADAIDAPQGTVNQRLRKLIEEGKVVRRWKGNVAYYLAAKHLG